MDLECMRERIQGLAKKINPFPAAAAATTGKEAGKAYGICSCRAFLVLLATSLALRGVDSFGGNDYCAYARHWTSGSSGFDPVTFVCWKGSEYVFDSGSCELEGYIMATTELEISSNETRELDSVYNVIFWNVEAENASGVVRKFEPSVGAPYNEGKCNGTLTIPDAGTIVDDCGLEGWKLEDSPPSIWGFCVVFFFSISVLLLFECTVIRVLVEGDADSFNRAIVSKFWEKMAKGVDPSDATSVPTSIKVVRFVLYSVWFAFPSSLVGSSFDGCPSMIGAYYPITWIDIQMIMAIILILVPVLYLISTALKKMMEDTDELQKPETALCYCALVAFRYYGIFAILVNFAFGSALYIILLFQTFPEVSVPGFNVPFSSWPSDRPALVASRVFVLLVGLVDTILLMFSLLQSCICKHAASTSSKQKGRSESVQQTVNPVRKHKDNANTKEWD
eukprot:gb/GECG01002370.1/.p1 GENE.gb/GECG01002370.1/~~gb/GECG01002370.1/.p1  ORF type:complete len:450 (+),score=40.31 gb/GECG01002370.1/:1-1350(+)